MSVLPDVAGLDRTFDYTVPDDLDGSVRLGTIVRVDLAGRRVRGWVAADGVPPPPDLALRPLVRVTGWGPEPDVIAVAAWAAWRWAGRRRQLLVSASPPGAVASLPVARLRSPAPPRLPPAVGDLASAALARGGTSVVRLPPAVDAIGLVAAAAQLGPVLVVTPSVDQASSMAARLRRGGAGVAEVPSQWAQARAGAAVVVGARAAAWAPCPGLAAAVVVDAHDEALVQEQSPAWWASLVVEERAARAGAPCLLVSSCPTLDLVVGREPVLTLPADRERGGWAPLEVVDRRADDPRLGLYSEPLARLIRHGRVACVLNRTGRARLLACGACRSVARCERCGAAVATLDDPALLCCRRCGTGRPVVCVVCGSTALRQLRVGVSRAREELEALAGRPVGEVTAATRSPRGRVADVVVGTEAVLHRREPVDAVAFLDFDQELLAARLRAGEEALALLARASRLVGGRARGGRVLVQTRLPDHEVIRAATMGDPGLVSAAESAVRRPLRLPPWSALAELTGPGAGQFAASLVAAGAAGIEVLGPDAGRFSVRAGGHATLADALASVERPGERVRVEVDPLRS